MIGYINNVGTNEALILAGKTQVSCSLWANLRMNTTLLPIDLVYHPTFLT